MSLMLEFDKLPSKAQTIESLTHPHALGSWSDFQLIFRPKLLHDNLIAVFSCNWDSIFPTLDPRVEICTSQNSNMQEDFTGRDKP